MADNYISTFNINGETVPIKSEGSVESVNGKTGDVTLSASDVGALSVNGGTVNGETKIFGETFIQVPIPNNDWKRSYVLISDVTGLYKGTSSSKQGFIGITFQARGNGFMSDRISFIIAEASYGMKEPYDDQVLSLQTTSNNLRPCVVKNMSEDKYYIALSIVGIDSYLNFSGRFTGNFIKTVVPSQNTDWEIVRDDYRFINTANTIRATDTHALLGAAGADSTVQDLIDAIANRVIDKLLPRDGSKAMTGTLQLSKGMRIEGVNGITLSDSPYNTTIFASGIGTRRLQTENLELKGFSNDWISLSTQSGQLCYYGYYDDESIENVNIATEKMLSNWVDITNDCMWNINIKQEGKFRSFIKYNKYTKQIVGVIDAYDFQSVQNQSTILHLPYFEDVENGTGSYEGLCGIGINSSSIDGMLIMARKQGREIISSHSIDNDAVGCIYLINFILD